MATRAAGWRLTPAAHARELSSLALSLAALNQQALALDKRILALRGEAKNAAVQGQQGSTSLATGRTTVEKTEAQLKLLEKKASKLETAKPAIQRHPGR